MLIGRTDEADAYAFMGFARVRNRRKPIVAETKTFIMSRTFAMITANPTLFFWIWFNLNDGAARETESSSRQEYCTIGFEHFCPPVS